MQPVSLLNALALVLMATASSAGAQGPQKQQPTSAGHGQQEHPPGDGQQQREKQLQLHQGKGNLPPGYEQNEIHDGQDPPKHAAKSRMDDSVEEVYAAAAFAVKTMIQNTRVGPSRRLTSVIGAQQRYLGGLQHLIIAKVAEPPCVKPQICVFHTISAPLARVLLHHSCSPPEKFMLC